MGLFNFFKKKNVETKAEEKPILKTNSNTFSNPVVENPKPAIPDTKGIFGGTVVRVLKENYQEFGFEKKLEKKLLLRKGNAMYYQTIEKSVASENNGRPNTYYSEYVYQIDASNIDDVSSKNVWNFVVSDCIFRKCTAKPGVWF